MISCETRLVEGLKRIRGSRSQADFALLLGVKQQTYSNWERGRVEPSLSVLAGIAKHFNVSVDWLLGLDDNRGMVRVTATDHSVAANNSTVSDSAEVSRLLGIIESQQKVIQKLAGA